MNERNNIKAVYLMYVYEDGSVVLNEQVSTRMSLDTSNCSASVSQVLMVLENVAKNNSSKSIRRKVTEAINSTAHSQGLEVSSIMAKITRKLGVSMKEFKNAVENYFNNESDELVQLLKENYVKKNKEADLAAIEALFSSDWFPKVEDRN